MAGTNCLFFSLCQRFASLVRHWLGEGQTLVLSEPSAWLWRNRHKSNKRQQQQLALPPAELVDV